MPTTVHYVKLLEEICGAPGNVERWQALLNRLCETFNGSSASFISIQSRSRDAHITLTARTDPAALAAYQQHWHQFDPWARGITQSSPPAGTVLVGDQFIAADEMRRSNFYNEFGRSYRITQSLAGMIEASPNQFSCLSINRGDDAEPFQQRDVALLETLMPHLQRALQVHRRITTAESMSESFAEIASRSDHGVLLLSANGRVRFANRVAERILASKDGLTVESGELRTAVAAQTRDLRNAFRAAASLNADSPVSPPLLIGRIDRRPLVVVVAPVRRTPGIADHNDISVAVFVTDPENRSLPDAEFIRTTLRLTPAEARLVLCLVQGMTLEQSAVHLRVAIGTLRTRLKKVFQKTNTNRQAELVRLAIASMTPR